MKKQIKLRNKKLELNKRALRHSTPQFQHGGRSHYWGDNYQKKKPSPWCKE